MSRRRKSSYKDSIQKLIIMGALFVAILVSLLVANINPNGFSAKLFLITFIISFVFFGLCYLIFSIPVVKGKIGEAIVSKRIKKLIKKYGGYLIDDVIIPDEDNDKTSQIDHIYFSNYGVFVFETKNYAGRIYGKDGMREWTQVLAYGNVKNKLYNPVMQNGTHIARLKKLLSIKENFESVIVFVWGNTKYIESEYVYSVSDIKHLIGKKSEKVFTNEQVDRLYEIVNKYKENPIQSTKEHVKEINSMLKDIDNNVCPRCSGKLVLRQSKDGSPFYGCSNYPKCSFTKKLHN